MTPFRSPRAGGDAAPEPRRGTGAQVGGDTGGETLMLRRHLMGLLSGAAAAPAIAKAQARAEMVAARLPLPGATGESSVAILGSALSSSAPPNGLTRAAYALLRREQHELGERLNIRRRAWEMPLDPDLAARTSCSEVYLRHLQERRLRDERRRMEELEWRMWPPEWAER